MTTAEKIRQARKAAGLSQAQLAEKLGVTQNQISEYETGKRKPKLSTLLRIAEAMPGSFPDIVLGDDMALPNGFLEKIADKAEELAALPDPDAQREKLLSLYDSVTDPARGLIVGYAEGVASNPENRRDK